MRGLIDDLATPSPLERALPGLLQQDDFACRFVGAFDSVLAPVFGTLDNFPAYVDPGTAPSDFVEWLAGWLGLVLDGTWSDERRRQAVREVVELYRWRGTARGLKAHVALYLGLEPEIEEGGGVVWSPAPGAALPGEATDRVLVRVRVPEPGAIDASRLDAIVRAVKPAHLGHEIDIVGDEPGDAHDRT